MKKLITFFKLPINFQYIIIFYYKVIIRVQKFMYLYIFTTQLL